MTKQFRMDFAARNERNLTFCPDPGHADPRGGVKQPKQPKLTKRRKQRFKPSALRCKRLPNGFYKHLGVFRVVLRTDFFEQVRLKLLYLQVRTATIETEQNDEGV